MPATRNPVAAKAASSICTVSWKANGCNNGTKGLTLAIRPSMVSKPVGAFIQALTVTTKIAEAAPLAATTNPAAKCARWEMRD